MKKIQRGVPPAPSPPVAESSSLADAERAEVAAVASGSVTLDTLLSGRLRILQSRAGYRFSLDALLLAGFATFKPHEKIADLGTGNGVLALLVAHREPSISVLGVELQEAMAERARNNVLLNAAADRVMIVQGDIRAIDRIAPPGSFAGVLCNPPYRKPTSGRLSPNSERQIARHEMMGSIDDFIRAATYLLAAKGRMTLVYPAVRAIDLLSGLRRADIEPKRLRMVHSSSTAEASLILVEGVKEGRSGLTILPPLIVYRSDGSYSHEVEAMLSGK